MLVVVVVIAGLFLFARIGSKVAHRMFKRFTALDAGARVLGEKLLSIAIWTFAVLVGIDILGIDLTALAVFSGAFGLAVGGSNYRLVTGAALTTPLSTSTARLFLDVFIPGNQPNPSWLGAVQVFASCPSVALNNEYVGQVELTGKPTNAFSTLTFTVPATVRSACRRLSNMTSPSARLLRSISCERAPGSRGGGAPSIGFARFTLSAMWAARFPKRSRPTKPCGFITRKNWLIVLGRLTTFS